MIRPTVSVYTLLKFFCIFIVLLIIPHEGQGSEVSKPHYNFGVISVNHPLVIYRQYQPFIDYINSKQDAEYVLVLKHTYADVLSALREGSLDVALLAGNTFIHAGKQTDIVPLVATVSGDGTTDTHSLIVARDTNNAIQSLSDLRGKSFGFGSQDSTASYLMPRYFLAKQGVFIEDFSRYHHFNSHDAVARAVLRGDVDAGAIGAPLVARFLGEGLKIIAVTEPFPGFLVVARKSVPEREREVLMHVLLSLSPKAIDSRNHAPWPELFRYGFAPVDSTRYKLFEDILHRLDSLEQNKE